jgi:hypothetical protein
MERIPEIIKGPAKVAGLKVEESFVQAAMHDASSHNALPLPLPCPCSPSPCANCSTALATIGCSASPIAKPSAMTTEGHLEKSTRHLIAA